MPDSANPFDWDRFAGDLSPEDAVDVARSSGMSCEDFARQHLETRFPALAPLEAERASAGIARVMVLTAAFERLSLDDAVREANSASDDYETYVREDFFWNEFPDDLREQLLRDPEAMQRVITDLVGVMYRAAVYSAYPGPEDPELRHQLMYWGDDRLNRMRTFAETLDELRFELSYWQRKARQSAFGCGGRALILTFVATASAALIRAVLS